MSIAETVPDVLRSCAAGFVPAGVPIAVAIEAHRHMPGVMTITAIVLGRTPEPADSIQQLDYLAALPDEAWSVYGGEWEEQRDLTLAAIRRSIAWSTICA